MRFLYVSSGSALPPDTHLMQGLREEGHEVTELTEDPGRYAAFAVRFMRAATPDAVIIGYGLPLFVPIARCLTCRKIVFNAIASQYEANVISRGEHPRSLAAFKWKMVDLISFWCSSIVLLESAAQIAYIRSLFHVPYRKLAIGRMGVDEEVFFKDDRILKRKEFTVLFRGRFLPESGILTVLEAAKKLEPSGIRFLVIGHGFLYREVHALMERLRPTNVELVEETLPAKELREQMLSCHLCLGQLADHPRLARTLPAKLYESLALGLPYLTGRNAAVFELLTENETCFAVRPGDAEELASKILELRDSPALKEVAERGYQLYAKRLTARALAKEFVAALDGKRDPEVQRLAP